MQAWSPRSSLEFVWVSSKKVKRHGRCMMSSSRVEVSCQSLNISTHEIKSSLLTCTTTCSFVMNSSGAPARSALAIDEDGGSLDASRSDILACTWSDLSTHRVLKQFCGVHHHLGKYRSWLTLRIKELSLSQLAKIRSGIKQELENYPHRNLSDVQWRWRWMSLFGGHRAYSH